VENKDRSWALILKADKTDVKMVEDTVVVILDGFDWVCGGQRKRLPPIARKVRFANNDRRRSPHPSVGGLAMTDKDPLVFRPTEQGGGSWIPHRVRDDRLGGGMTEQGG
jgi:hypothetical protein